MSFVIAINENEFVSIYGNKIKSGAERQEHFEVHTVKIPVNLGEATIYEDYSEAQDILEQIKHRKKYITMYGWTCYKEHELHKIVDKLYIAFVITGEITDTVFNVITEIDKKYYKRLKDYEHFKERYDVIFRSANPESPFETLPQYALDRDDFIRIYGNISEALMNESWYETSDFKGWYNDDEWYILHKPSGTMINWYKHCGRTNTCNKVLTVKQHEEFAKMILNDMKDNRIGAD